MNSDIRVKTIRKPEKVAKEKLILYIIRHKKTLEYTEIIKYIAIRSSLIFTHNEYNILTDIHT